MPNYICKLNLDGTERTIKDPNAIRYDGAQSLTDAQKAQARANIGASSSGDIPTVNNATLTIQKNGTNVQTFTANQSANATANITVPTKVSELTNDSGYTTNTGTITGIKMNGASKGTSGVVDLGTVLTSDEKMFRTDDTAETAIADGDYFPFYDTSASAKRKTLWSNIINTLKNTFAIKNHRATGTTYGVGTSSYYGHNKIIDNLYKTSLVDGESLSAHMGSNLAKMVAPLESGTTASQAYAAGKEFIYDSTLYRTWAAIASGGAITPNTNCGPADDVANRVLSSVTDPFTDYRKSSNGIMFPYFSSTWHPYRSSVTDSEFVGVIFYQWQGRFIIIGSYISGSKLGDMNYYFGRCWDPANKDLRWKKFYLQST